MKLLKKRMKAHHVSDSFQLVWNPTCLRRRTSEEDKMKGHTSERRLTMFFPPKWSTGLIMLWSNEAGPPDFSCRDCDYIMNRRLFQTKSVNDQRCVALCRAFFQFWKHFVIRSRTTWWPFLLFMSAGLDLSVFCVIYFICFICCTSFVFLSAVLSFSGTHFL